MFRESAQAAPIIKLHRDVCRSVQVTAAPRSLFFVAASLGNRFGTRLPERTRLDLGHQLGKPQVGDPLDARRHRRFKLDVEICVYPHDSAVVRGHTVDISESGISAILPLEVPVGEVVRLEFSLPSADVEVFAMVRQRNAFRYGFQFVEDTSALGVIGRTCRELAIEQSVAYPENPEKA